MNILLVSPTRLDEQGQPVKYRTAFAPPIALAILDRLTPRQHTVRIVNDVVERIDFSGDYDLVGITALTSQSRRAYQIADAFRQRGVKVVMGGMHASLLPEEAGQHADAVVIGEAEKLWEQVLDDCERHALNATYQDTELPDLQQLVIPRWDHVNLNIYPRPLGDRRPGMLTFTTRGCPYACKFCSLSKFSGHRYRVRPVSHVLQEIENTQAWYYFFADDNLGCNPDYARELFKALATKQVRWVSQVSTTILKHPDLLELAAKAGCTTLLMGLESINPASLSTMRKGFNRVEQYEELFARMHKVRITPAPNLILGFDEDTPEQFRLTLDFLRKNTIRDALFWILTPYPGTELFDEMRAAGRILHTDWALYDAAHVVFRPQNFTPSELTEFYWKTYRDFYSFRNFFEYVLQSRHFLLLPNLLVKGIIRKKILSREHPTACGVGRQPS